METQNGLEKGTETQIYSCTMQQFFMSKLLRLAMTSIKYVAARLVSKIYDSGPTVRKTVRKDNKKMLFDKQCCLLRRD